MSGHVQISARSDANRDVNGDFAITEASWTGSQVELRLQHTNPHAASLDELTMRLDTAAVMDIFRAILRFATDTELGVLE